MIFIVFSRKGAVCEILSGFVILGIRKAPDALPEQTFSENDFKFRIKRNDLLLPSSSLGASVTCAPVTSLDFAWNCSRNRAEFLVM